MPERIQRKRMKGWRMPEGAVCVTRPGPWGNPWEVEGLNKALMRSVSLAAVRSDAFWYAAFSATPAGYPLERLDLGPLPAEIAVMLFRRAGVLFQARDPHGFDAWLAPLRGRDLACWCDADAPHCHADVLIEWANAEWVQAPAEDSEAADWHVPRIVLPGARGVAG